ncbi:HPF/RaiA family ribosome-associated protein [Muricauda sp. 2012CJ35-5]|uniref:HPF/RaiA family ribosome-associated protein n=1 Tax=Flagellimonas spongiicola TaxID=2942208 RepID=A0ABT0PTS1_9FLAO|nr:HPF/RaiA family ribosome-associated protein [Allomuricauda spongiicola]MCL6274793.1 HPF/RaiA family ribosome-associated protein [Allomuricauda spongiicola]
MVINIQYQKMPSSESLNKLLLKKLHRLGDKYSWVIKANVLFKEEHDKSGEDNICEIELSAPGPRMFAKSRSNDFEKAMAETINDLKRQLEKRHDMFVRH